MGISAKYCKKIFEMFHQLDPNSSAGGEGLGLAIVKRILDRLQGTITLESEPGTGTTFIVTLPRS